MSQKLTRKRKIESPVTLFAAIDQSQHEFLRSVAFREHRSLADVVREALNLYQQRKEQAGRRAGAAVGLAPQAPARAAKGRD